MKAMIQSFFATPNKKKLVLFCAPLLFLLFKTDQAAAQCLSGNCENGIGEVLLINRYYKGIYKGECKNNEPSGRGIFTGATGPNFLNSIKAEGKFAYGYLISGRVDVYDNDIITRTFDYPKVSIENHIEYNVKGKVVKQKEVKVQEYVFGKYRGDLKNNIPNGRGSFEQDFFSFDGKFVDGFPVSIDSAYRRVNTGLVAGRLYLKFVSYIYKNIEIKNGSIVKMDVTDNADNKYQVAEPISLTQWMSEGMDNGFYNATLASGDSYRGMMSDFKFDGSGLFTSASGDGYIKGNFMAGVPHGLAKTEGKDFIDSGLYIRNVFVKGYYILKSEPKKIIKFPICISGMCDSGYGKISFIKNSSTANYHWYEGNLVNGLPNGFGRMQEVINGVTKTTSGNFVQGLLNGTGTYEGNAGVVTKMTGTFEADTLKEGTVFYEDGSSFRFTRAEYNSVMDKSTGGEKTAFLRSATDRKYINGNGVYTTPAGARVKGLFRNAMLFEGLYVDSAGNRISLNGDIDADNLDNSAAQILASVRADKEQKRQEAAQYLADKKREALYEEAAKNPNNFREEYITSKCTACNGSGFILSGYSVGSTSYVSEEYLDKSGNWRRDLHGFVPAHYVTSRTPCSACKKRGTVTVLQKKYTGPSF